MVGNVLGQNLEKMLENLEGKRLVFSPNLLKVEVKTRGLKMEEAAGQIS